MDTVCKIDYVPESGAVKFTAYISGFKLSADGAMLVSTDADLALALRVFSQKTGIEEFGAVYVNCPRVLKTSEGYEVTYNKHKEVVKEIPATYPWWYDVISEVFHFRSSIEGGK